MSLEFHMELIWIQSCIPGVLFGTEEDGPDHRLRRWDMLKGKRTKGALWTW